MSETRVVVSKRYRFPASHRLHVPAFSERQNTELYGKCNNPYGHGHDYTLDVSVAGPVDSTSGKMFCGDELDGLVQQSVLQTFSHRYLNADVSEFTAIVPTTENVARAIGERLLGSWGEYMPGQTSLARIYIEETPRNSFEVLFPTNSHGQK